VKAVEQIIEKISVEPNRMSNTNTKYGAGGDFAPKYGGGGGDYAPKYGGGNVVDYKSGFSLSTNIGQRSAPQYSHVQDEPAYKRYSSPQDDALRYPMHGNANAGVGGYDAAASYQPRSKAKASHLIQMEIPNSMVGSIVGKQGVTINEFSRSSGAQISFSGKEEFAPGTQDRILTIKGTQNQIQHAYMMIDQKVAEVEMEFRRPSYN